MGQVSQVGQVGRTATGPYVHCGPRLPHSIRTATTDPTYPAHQAYLAHPTYAEFR